MRRNLFFFPSHIFQPVNDNVYRQDKLKILLEKRLKKFTGDWFTTCSVRQVSTFGWILCKLSYDEILARDKNVVFEQVFIPCSLSAVTLSLYTKCIFFVIFLTFFLVEAFLLASVLLLLRVRSFFFSLRR